MNQPQGPGYTISEAGIIVDIHPNGTLTIINGREQITMGSVAADVLARALQMTAGLRRSALRRRYKTAYTDRYGETEV